MAWLLANHDVPRRDAVLDYQRSENALVGATGYIMRWHSFWCPRILIHPLRPFTQNYYGKVMDTYIERSA